MAPKQDFKRPYRGIMQQRGSTVYAFLVALLAIFAGAITVGLLSAWIGLHPNAVASSSWKFSGLFMAIIGFAAFLRDRLDKLLSHDGLKPREQERLNGIIHARQREIFYIIIFNIVSLVIFIFISMMPSKGASIPSWFNEIVGGVIGFSIYLVFVIWKDVSEARTFKSKLDVKTKRLKRRQDVINKINGHTS